MRLKMLALFALMLVATSAHAEQASLLSLKRLSFGAGLQLNMKRDERPRPEAAVALAYVLTPKLALTAQSAVPLGQKAESARIAFGFRAVLFKGAE